MTTAIKYMCAHLMKFFRVILLLVTAVVYNYKYEVLTTMQVCYF